MIGSNGGSRIFRRGGGRRFEVKITFLRSSEVVETFFRSFFLGRAEKILSKGVDCLLPRSATNYFIHFYADLILKSNIKGYSSGPSSFKTSRIHRYFSLYTPRTAEKNTLQHSVCIEMIEKTFFFDFIINLNIL
jgi:hypothetical protein